MKTISKVLIANRGEIARRIIRTCREMGLATVAVYSDADEGAPFVREAGEAVRIGPAPSRESYLVAHKLFEAARLTGADAIHPGYGFLSENEGFAAACRDEGIVFVGPSPEAILAMGKKREAKEIAKAAGVPVVPGYNGTDQANETLAREATAMGFPVLVKASAGGGGKGMRVVREAASLAEALDGARREALSSFGDGTLILERYVERPRHIEVQILGDQHGELVHLFERECSIQRRHQKVVEETPSVLLTPELRAKMGEAAVRIGRAIGYSSAGTVEFIATQGGDFYFLEVNTRLQVEHPVTELVVRANDKGAPRTLDLVREQLRVARGERLGYAQTDLSQEGAAIEVRLCAEDPLNEFLPSTGEVIEYIEPTSAGLRVDSGIEKGSVVGIHYDPMLAKVIAYGATREEARSRLLRGLGGLVLAGVAHNVELLKSILSHEAFVAGALHTHFLEQHFAEAASLAPTEEFRRDAAIAAVLSGAVERGRVRPVLSSLRLGYRNSRFALERTTLSDAHGSLEVGYAHEGGERFVVSIDGGEREHVRLQEADGEFVLENARGIRRRVLVRAHEAARFVHLGERSTTFIEAERFPAADSRRDAGSCVAPMPGKVIAVRVAVGDAVVAGGALVVLEAMKMEHTLRAPHDGVVRVVRVTPGQQVDGDAVLVVVGTDA
jgi:acetyl/propionyl-CoA carboxylase alpha subunit